MNICVYAFAKLFYVHLNKKREKTWNAMTEDVSPNIPGFERIESSVSFHQRKDRATDIGLQERIHYLETTSDVGSSRKDFRFAH